MARAIQAGWPGLAEARISPVGQRWALTSGPLSIRGVTHGDEGRQVRHSTRRTQSVVHRYHCVYAGRWNWREHCCVQPRVCPAAAIAACSRTQHLVRYRLTADGAIPGLDLPPTFLRDFGLSGPMFD